jgi:hypothetical protein
MVAIGYLPESLTVKLYAVNSPRANCDSQKLGFKTLSTLPKPSHSMRTDIMKIMTHNGMVIP